jgi:hypothetical protein
MEMCEASYKVSYDTACCSEAHMINENLITPCALDIVSCVHGDNHLKTFKKVAFSYSIVLRSIKDITCNTEFKLNRLKAVQDLLCKLMYPLTSLVRHKMIQHFFTQNNSYDNIQKFDTYFMEYPVCD